MGSLLWVIWREDGVQKLLDGLNLFAVGEAFEDRQLRLHDLNKVIEFGAFKLGKDGFC